MVVSERKLDDIISEIKENNKEPYCFGYKNVPFIDSYDCGKCKFVEKCISETYKKVDVL